MATLAARFKPGENVPVFANTQINAGTFVKIVGDKTSQGDYKAQHCVLGDKAFGVAEADSAATTDDANSVWRRINVVRRGCIARVKPGAAIDASAGAVAVMSDANGKAVAWDTNAAHAILGYALSSCAGTDDFVEVDLL